MIDHITLRVRDLAAAKAFYSAALAPLGYVLGHEFPDGAGMGAGGKLDFWLAHDPEARPQHLAFAAPDRGSVDAFYAAALAAGGADNGPPGLRLQYHPHYYAAFVFDPSGHNMEVVHHLAPSAARAKPAATRRASAKKGTARKAGAKKVATSAKRTAAKPTRKRSSRGRKG